MQRSNQTPVVFKYEHFVGNQTLDFDLVDKPKTEKLIDALRSGASYKDVLHDIFDNNFDALARSASYAFYLEKITSDELGTILRYRSMHLSFPQDEVELCPFFDKDKTGFAKEVLGFLPALFEGETQKEDVVAFFKTLKEKPSTEHCYFIFNVPSSYFYVNEKVERFLKLLGNENIIGVKTDHMQQKTSVLVYSMSAKNALNKALFKDNAKLAFPRLSNTIKIDDIDYSTENDTRYVAAFHPDVVDQPIFHGIKVKETIFSSLHDDLHVRINCRLPKQIFKPWRKAIQMVRSKTGIHWSKDIWDTIDGAFSPFFIYRNCLLENTKEAITKLFLKVLDADIYPENRAMGLFTQTSFFDTTWLLLIDIALNTKDWLEFSIDPVYFNFDYAEMYAFIQKNIDLIKDEKNHAKQVALIKAKYFNIKLKTEDEYQFEKKGRYTQLVNKVNSKPLLLDKGVLLETMQLIGPIRPLGMTFYDLGMLFVNGDLKVEDLDDKQFKQKLNGRENSQLHYLMRSGYFSLSQFIKLSSEQVELINQIRADNVAFLLNAHIITSSAFMALSIERANLINAYSTLLSLIFHKKMDITQFNGLSKNAIQLLLNDNAVYQSVFEKKLSLDKLELLAASQQMEVKDVNEKEVNEVKEDKDQKDKDKNTYKGKDKLKTSGQHLKKLSLFQSANPVELDITNNENNNDRPLSENKMSTF